MIELIARLHPAIVHLPIGFILLSIIIDVYDHKNQLQSQISMWAWAASSLSSLVAVGTGFLLLNTGHYESLNTFLHQLGGIFIAVLCLLMLYTKVKSLVLFNYQNLVIHSLIGIAIAVTGHLGGVMTHGEEYLQLPFTKDYTEETIAPIDADSVLIYNDLIAPLFVEYCTKCHEEGDARGQLIMTDESGLSSNIYGDPAVAPYDLHNSAAYQRVILPEHDKKHMPPSSASMSFEEIRLLQWWILTGASFTDHVSAVDIPQDVEVILTEKYHIILANDDNQIPDGVEFLATEILQEKQNLGFNIQAIAMDNPMLYVDRNSNTTELRVEDIQQLAPIGDNIVSLDLRDSGCDDAMLKIIGQFKHLEKLSIQNTSISDNGISHLINLKALKSLNIYGSNITDSAISDIVQLSALEVLYIWQTAISSSGVEELLDSNNELEIIGQQTLKSVK